MIQDSFPDKKLCTISGKNSEYIVFTRIGKTTSVWANNYEYKGLLNDNTALEPGDLVSVGTDKYLTKYVRDTYFSKQAQLALTNAVVNVVRPTKQFVGGSFTGYTEVSVESSVPALQETITGKMQMLEPGLLSTTVKRFLMQDIGIVLLDRIKLGSENYQVDVFDNTSFPGLISVQCSVDKRK